MGGIILEKPTIMFRGKTQPDDKGNLKHRGHLKEAFSFTDWVIVYS